MNFTISHEYEVDYYIYSILALPNESMIAFCSSKNTSKKYLFILFHEGETEEFIFDLQNINLQVSLLKPALFKRNKGFGCVFYNMLVTCDLETKSFNYFPIKNIHTNFKNNGTIEPIKAVEGMNSDEVIILLNDEFNKPNGRYISKIKLKKSRAAYSKLLFNVPNEKSKVEICDITFLDQKIVFHTIGGICNYSRYGMDYSKIGTLDTTGLIFTKNKLEFIKEVSEGFGYFSSDLKSLLILSLRNPKKIEFFTLSAEKEAELKLTPKVLGKIDKKTRLIDKYNNRIWLGNDTGEVTELNLVE